MRALPSASPRFGRGLPRPHPPENHGPATRSPIWANFYLWFAASWTAVIALHELRWSSLNQPLDHRLLAFLAFAIGISLILAVIHAFNEGHTVPQTTPMEFARLPATWTIAIVIGFAADFAYRREVPLFTSTYRGYDVTVDVQPTVGIPVVHVALIATAIFYSSLLAQTWLSSRSRVYLVQFLAIQVMLLLNYSRGYIAFSLFAAILLYATYRPGRGRMSMRPATVAGVLLAMYGLCLAIGYFGNVRSGDSWSDASHISSIGLYNDSFPGYVDPSLKWVYSYLTSPLANLNYNISSFSAGGAPVGALVALLPDTIGKYLGLSARSVQYQVDYFNASTAYADSYYLGGGLAGMYLMFIAQMALLGLGSIIARRLRVGPIFNVLASLLVVGLVFFNTFSDTATCYLLPLALLLGLLHRARPNADGVVERAHPDRQRRWA